MGENAFEFEGLFIETDETMPISKNSNIIVFGNIGGDKTTITLDISKDENLLRSINKIMSTPYLIGKGPNSKCIVKRSVEDFEHLNSKDAIMLPFSFGVEFTEEKTLRATIYFKFGWEPKEGLDQHIWNPFGPRYTIIDQVYSAVYQNFIPIE